MIRGWDKMNDRTKLIVTIVVIACLTLTAIVCVNIGLGYYLRNNEFTDVYSYEPNSEIVRTTKENWSGVGEVNVLNPNTGSAKGWEKKPLQENAVQIILIAIDIALIVVGVFAFLIVRKYRKQDKHETVSLFVLLGIFIVLASITVFCIYNYFVHM